MTERIYRIIAALTAVTTISSLMVSTASAMEKKEIETQRTHPVVVEHSSTKPENVVYEIYVSDDNPNNQEEKEFEPQISIVNVSEIMNQEQQNY